MQDWLFDLPRSEEGFVGQLRIAIERVQADPEAAAIDDAAAENFMAAAFTVRYLQEKNLRSLARAFGVRVSHTGPKARRYAVTAILRRWDNPKCRDFLLNMLVPNTGYGWLPAANDAGDQVTVNNLIDAFFDGTNLVWIVKYMRNLGWAEAIPGFFSTLGPRGEGEYYFWLHVGRLTLRRLLSGAPAGPAAAESEYRRLKQQLQVQETVTRALQAEKQRLEDTRRDLARTAQRSEGAAADLLEQTRAEAAAAAAELGHRREAQGRELAAAEARHGARVQALQRQVAAARQEFAAALAERAASAEVAPLRGYTVAVRGGGADPADYRLLIESAGGQLVDGGADLTVIMQAGEERRPGPGCFCTADAGLAAFERLLRAQILPAVARPRGNRPAEA